MAMSAQTSNNNTSYFSDPTNAAAKRDLMILNELKGKNSVFFAKAGKDGNVHVIVPRITDAASNKKIHMARNVYIAQGFKTMGIKTHRAITYNGAKSLGTSIQKEMPHVEITSSYKISDKERNSIAQENETLSKNSDYTSKLKFKANQQALETGYRNVAYTYYPAFAVVDKNALKNSFRIPGTPDIDQKKWEAFRKEMEIETGKAKANLPVIDGNNAKDWKEHVKNCMTGNEVVLSQEKAREFATAMINDLENAREQGNPFLFQQTAKNAAAELYKEAKDKSIEQQREVLGLEEKTAEVEPQAYSTEEEISF